MVLPIHIDDLIRHRRVESARIEYKKDWNPERVLHSVCAFANDIDNWGGMPAIIRACEGNGYSLPRFETDEDRRQLRVVLPIHSAFLAGCQAPDGENNPFAVQKPSVGTLQETTQETSQETTQKTTQKILSAIADNPRITRQGLSVIRGITPDGVKKALEGLKSAGLIRRVGPDKGGHWEVFG